MACWKKRALSRFSNALKIIALSFIHSFTANKALSWPFQGPFTVTPVGVQSSGGARVLVARG